MTLNNLREIISQNRKKILIILMILALTGGALVYYFSSRNGVPGEEEETPKEETWKAEGFSFAGDTRSIKDRVDLSKLQDMIFPETAAIYQVEQDKKTIGDQEANEIATRFGFTEDVENRVKSRKPSI